MSRGAKDVPAVLRLHAMKRSSQRRLIFPNIFHIGVQTALYMDEIQGWKKSPLWENEC